MGLISRRNIIQSGALIAFLPPLVFSQQPNSPDIGSPIPWSQVKLLNDEVLKSSQFKGQVLVPHRRTMWCQGMTHW